MVDPLMIAVATTLAAKTAEGLSEAGRAAIGKLIQRVRGRLAAEPEGADALESARRQPEERQRLERLAAALSDAAERDPLVAADVARLCAALREGGVAADGGGVVNQVSGSVGESLVQARDVSGGITFGARPDPGAREAR